MSGKKKSKKAKKESFPIVAIGASAGGLSAFEAFFSSVPNVNPKMAFILIQHLDPDHKSILNEIIQRYTSMKVFEVEDGMLIEPHCVYIIPPKYNIAIRQDSLQLLTPSEARGHRLPIDFFFTSLAQAKKEDAIGIVFSGTGRDGTEGIRAIKEHGGLVIAQDVTTAEFDGMPKSALDSGLVDYSLAPNEIFPYLVAYASHQLKEPLLLQNTLKDTNSLKKIFALLHSKTGHDFSMYKPSTIKRRIERRMAVHQIETLEQYVNYLQSTKIELGELFEDLLIGVTNFFRDPDLFAALEENAIPKLFLQKPFDSTIRVWIAGCSTGEEAYSIAILLMEYKEKLDAHYNIQVFATDIDVNAIAIARAGLYPLSVAKDISKERLERFFTLNEDSSMYRVHKNIRETLIFSEHNLIKDPPFSRLDMISCRNLLIYMSASLQQKLIPLFHYSLNPNGILFLGSSESIGEFDDFFELLDKKAKIYQVKNAPNNSKIIPSSRIQPMERLTQSSPPIFKQNQTRANTPLRELMETIILKEVVPSAALVNSQGDILYLHGRTGRYLEVPAGEAGVNNILLMAREGLGDELAQALQKAVYKDEVVSKTEILIKTNDHFNIVNVQVHPVRLEAQLTAHEPLYVVTLEEVSAIGREQANKKSLQENAPLETKKSKDGGDVKKLKQELYLKEKFLQTANDKVRTYNEELKSFNEEIQSMNEELQSTNEELETSKEELQSVNEELSTVNSELQDKVADLSRSNNDMNNLLAGTGIGTVFVDHKLCVLRFTPAITSVINLISVDVGRYIGHIVSNVMDYNNLTQDIKSVLDTLIPKEIEVQAVTGKWYLMRIHPYRTIENVIEGAVISFIDIDEIVKLRQELKKANADSRLSIVVRDSYDAIVVQDLEGTIIAWNPAAEKLYGWSEDEALTMNNSHRIPEELLEKELKTFEKLKNSLNIEPYVSKRLRKDAKLVDVSVTCSALRSADSKVYAITTTERTLNLKNESNHEK